MIKNSLFVYAHNQLSACCLFWEAIKIPKSNPKIHRDYNFLLSSDSQSEEDSFIQIDCRHRVLQILRAFYHKIRACKLILRDLLDDNEVVMQEFTPFRLWFHFWQNAFVFWWFIAQFNRKEFIMWLQTRQLAVGGIRFHSMFEHDWSKSWMMWKISEN